MSNYFQGPSTKPFHLSVGAILVNNKGEIACHYFKDAPIVGGEVCILMRETIEESETIEQALGRGLMEEFGAKGEVITYVGSLVKSFQAKGVTIQKTTLYLALRLTSIDPDLRDKDDPESSSEILWLKPSDLINKIKQCSKGRDLPDIDESEVIERAVMLGLIS